MKVDLGTEALNRGLSHSGMAREIGINRNTLKRAEEGERIHPGSALKIAKFLDLEVTDIWPVKDAEVTPA